MSHEEIDWSEPPMKAKPTGGHAAHVEFAEALRSNPGKWAKMDGDHASSQVTNIRKGTLKAFTGGEFEATSRGLPESRRCEVYVRFVGGPA